MVTEVLVREDDGWKNCLPLSDAVAKDACQQIETMIKEDSYTIHGLETVQAFTKGRVVSTSLISTSVQT
jgi:hypothetical protein